MAYSFPDPTALMDLGAELGMQLSEGEAGEYHAYLSQLIPAMRQLEMLPDAPTPVRYPRTPGFRPEGIDNPYNAWYYKSTIVGADSGKLRDKTIAVKDSICVAGVPMANGASIIEGYVPEHDATVVTWVLDAGGVILGKAACEYLCSAGNSATCSTGPVENPRVPGHTTGGSSNGCAALVASGDVDLAIGADQAGSVRIPAAFCGIVGLKPTYGLIPYTGAASIEYTIDHLGPMARSVRDCALMLEVLAGADHIDGRQQRHKTQSYTAALEHGVQGLRIGVVREGFKRPDSEDGVDEIVCRAIDQLKDKGAIVEPVSIPWHSYGASIWLPIGTEGPFMNMVYGPGVGYGTNGAYLLSYMKALEGWQGHANELPPTIKALLLSGQVMAKHGGRLYAKAQNLRRRLRQEYDIALAKCDVLVMPTTPMTAPKITPGDASVIDILTRSWEMLGNTCPFDLTGHPAISVNCGELDRRPVGFMVVGRHYDESLVLRVANSVHQQLPG